MYDILKTLAKPQMSMLMIMKLYYFLNSTMFRLMQKVSVLITIINLIEIYLNLLILIL